VDEKSSIGQAKIVDSGGDLGVALVGRQGSAIEKAR
jgi:hypothetical protein